MATPQVQTEPYTDLKLLECSRKSSIEVYSGNTSNNALFMNRVDEGFMLSPGDKVSVHSAMISEVGAGSNTIELKGNQLKGKIRIPNLIKYIPYNRNDYYRDDGYSKVLNTNNAVKTEKYTHTANLNDNQVHMTINYFKTTNGENCFSLPRRFGATDKKLAYDSVDSHLSGATIHQQRNGTIVEEDYGRDRNASSVWVNAWKDNRELLKVRQDGTKYTLFVRNGVTYYDPQTDTPSYPSAYESHNGNGSIDPAVATYYPYRELKSVTIPKGRRSADFIAETFTDSLQNASTIQKYEQWIDGANPSTYDQYQGQGVLGATYKTDTYKTFNCANLGFSKVNYNDAMAYHYTSTAPSPLNPVLRWMNSFQNVCFKRPDFVESGRQEWGANSFQGGRYKYITHVSNDNVSGRATMRIVFDVTYTERNCEDLAKWLKTQELYPEFWDFKNASSVYHTNTPRLTPDNSRFVHLDMLQAYENSSKTLASDRKEFGSDMNASTTIEATAIKYNTPSEPLFITYIKDDENTFYEEPEYNATSKKLTYGAFLNYRGTTGLATLGNIMITCEGVGGCPSKYYNSAGFFIGGEEAVTTEPNQYALPKYKRHIGYDPHFSAYGNAAIGLYTPSASGVNEMEGNQQIAFMTQDPNGAGSTIDEVVDRSHTINQVYLGSSNPKLTYDSVKDRFGFTEFYTPEYLGNDGAAGSDATNNPVKDGKALVYKINKRTRRQNYCPGMSPYPQKQEITPQNTNASSVTALKVDLPNKNIYPFSIMDCHSGIAIESFGIDEATWNRSLMGILGFTYDQLQSPVSASNTLQNRINTFNSKKLNRVTTQAEVQAQDTLVFNMNIWGAEMYKPNIASSLVLHDYKSSQKKFYQYFAPIIVDSDSLTITAEGVPRQMLNPFYTIRSDLIDDPHYMGSLDSGEKLPVIAHILKTTDSGDYFTSQDSSLEFTMTRSKPLSTITTAICDPDGTFSRVDDNSAVIYKVQRQNQLPMNLVQALFGGNAP